MGTLSEKHIELVRLVNESSTKIEHDMAYARLRGFRDCVDVVMDANMGSIGAFLMKADEYYIDQCVDRPMCCGVWLDWEPFAAKEV